MGTGTLASRHNAIDMIMGLGRPLTRPNKDELESRSPTLFVASERSPESSWGSFNEIVSKIPKTRVEIRVPTLSNPSEYRTFPYDPRINRVLEKRVRGKAAHYLVEKADGKQKEFSLERVKLLPGGSGALAAFNQSSRSSTSSSDPLQSDHRMPMTTRSQPQRRAQNGFVDSSHVYISDDEDDDEDLRPPKKQKRQRSVLRDPRTKFFFKYQQESSESVGESSESDFGLPKKKKSLPTRQLRSTGVSSNHAVNYDDALPETSDSDELQKPRGRPSTRAQAEPVRKSNRTGRQIKNMRELLEDEIPEVDSRGASSGRAKFSGAKEVFKPLPRDDEFRLRHCQSCDTCNGLSDDATKGRLVFCQGCSLSYHAGCLGPRNGREHLVTKVTEDDFVLQCRRCVEYVLKREPTAPHQSKCQECHRSGAACWPFRDRKTTRDEHKEREENEGADPVVPVPQNLLYNIRNVLFRCSSCYQAFHMHHLPSQVENMIDVDDEDQKAATRFSQYCRSWTCDDCAKAPAEIGALVAWRPMKLENYAPGQSVDQVPEDDKEYLIKWNHKSYYRSTWKRGAWVWGMTHKSMRIAFARKDNGIKLPKMRTEDAIPEDYLRVDIVFEVKYSNVVNTRVEGVELRRVKEVASARMKFKGLGYEDVVWEEPPSPNDAERWADFQTAYADWVRGRYIRLPSSSSLGNHVRKAKGSDFKSTIMLKEQPKTLKGGTLMDYQMEGVNWLLYQWHKNQNAILADEMGLGKTIQIVALMATLQERYSCWPFLVVVPNSTCANWRREIKTWAPGLRVVTYFGSAKARELAYKYELFPENPGDLRCHVVVTSYDAAQDEACQRVFKKINWAALIVDEGQRLKNDKNILYHALSQLKLPFKILLTGTPLQNNQRELFNLLQFLDDKISADALEAKYTDITKENVSELHDLLRPFFLRRTKAQVLTFLPPMAQIIVPVTMSALQKQLYKTILAKNSDLLKSIFAQDQRTQPVKGLRNILMQLRKCLCHPFVYNIAIEERSTEALLSHRRLVEASSKLQLLEIMLPLLKERGHRVLIFSQFLDMLSVMEDFLEGLALAHLRLDGSMGSLEKQKLIDAFNAPDSPVFAFLLSTRAGGVGINLATADTVIILDPDFNPHQDIQAISRAHRIGQQKKVLIFQLMTRGSAEEKIMQIGKKKMALDHVLIEQMDSDEADGNDLESVLRFGAEALFKDDESQDVHYDTASIEKLLDRSQVEDTKTGQDSSAESQFSFARIWQNESGSLEDGLQEVEEESGRTGAVWAKILEERAHQARMEEKARAEGLGRGKRQRRNVDYGKNVTSDKIEPVDEAPSDDHDTDFQARPSSDDDDSPIEDDEDVALHSRKPNLPLANAPPARPLAIVNSVDPEVLPLNQPFKRLKHYHQSAPIQEPPESSSWDTFDFKKPWWTATDGTDVYLVCGACKFAHGHHPAGACPLKNAGIEYCNLCGMAHYGAGNDCPHFHSETMISQMLQDLKSSPEAKDLRDRARTVLQGMKGALVQKKKRRAKEITERQQGLENAQAQAEHWQNVEDVRSQVEKAVRESPGIFTAGFPGSTYTSQDTPYHDYQRSLSEALRTDPAFRAARTAALKKERGSPMFPGPVNPAQQDPAFAQAYSLPYLQAPNAVPHSQNLSAMRTDLAKNVLQRASQANGHSAAGPFQPQPRSPNALRTDLPQHVRQRSGRPSSQGLAAMRNELAQGVLPRAGQANGHSNVGSSQSYPRGPGTMLRPSGWSATPNQAQSNVIELLSDDDGN